MTMIKENRDVDLKEKDVIKNGMEDTNHNLMQLKKVYED